MPLQIRAARVVEERRGVVGKELAVAGRQRRGLREISNIPPQITKRFGDLKITAPGKSCENKKLTKINGTSTSQKSTGNKAPVEKAVKALETPVVKHEIEDIDKLHEGNIYLVSEYAKDVYKYLMYLENKFSINKWPVPGSKITDTMRTMLVDWLVDVQVEFNLMQETLHIAVSILDRYLGIDSEFEKNVFQLVGISALSLACKYEEMLAPLVDDFIYLCKNAYQRSEHIDMEKKMLKALNYDLGRPVAVTFLRRYNMAAKADKLQHCYSKYFIDLALLDNKFSHIKPSLVAAAASFIAMCVIKDKVDASHWTPTMVHYSSYTMNEIKPVAMQMTKMIISISKSTFDSVKRKYSKSLFLGVSMKMISSMEIIKTVASCSTVAVTNS
uniref:Cyclin b n=1 Tax=Riptortus pedestris TaxID=329032 RepID=R4WTX7_RIPPE|nr:cyclin b [Riptortus pedestris]